MDDRLAAIRGQAAEQGRAFGPPLAEADIRAFETRHGVELPEGYRRFLTTVGNGGDGPPTYGLMRLGEVPRGLPADWAEEWRTLAHIGEPFPLTEVWVWEGEEYDEVRRDAARHGTLNLGHDGCGMYWLLVVTGVEWGQVWAHTDVGVCPQEPRFVRRQARTFRRRPHHAPLAVAEVIVRGQFLREKRVGSCSVENIAWRLKNHKVVGQDEAHEFPALALVAAAIDRRSRAAFHDGEPEESKGVGNECH